MLDKLDAMKAVLALAEKQLENKIAEKRKVPPPITSLQ